MKFFSDLDRTLIYSPRFVDDKAKCKLVEWNKDKEIAYMTNTAYELLAQVRRAVDFIPITTRNYEMLTQISFIQNDLPRTMVCDNGASIFIDGKRDMLWDFYIRDSQKNVKSLLSVIKFVQESVKEAVIIPENNLYIRLKRLTTEDTQMLEHLKNQLTQMGYRLYLSGTKAYIFPWFVLKEKAIIYLLDAKDYSKSISAGDSDMDVGMFCRTEISIAPKHYTFKTFPSTRITEHDGIEAGADILKMVSAQIR